MTITELHSLGRRKISGEQLHHRLHDMAVERYRVGSLSQLTPRQLDTLAEFLRSLPDLPSKRQQARRSGVYYNYSARPRTGSGGDADLKMISTGQRELIYKLANEMQWPASVFYRWLETNFRIKHPDEIRTSKLAKDVIQALIFRKRQQEHPQPSRSAARPWGYKEDGEARRRGDAPGGAHHRQCVTTSPPQSTAPDSDSRPGGMSRAAAFFANRQPASPSPQPSAHKEVPVAQTTLF